MRYSPVTFSSSGRPLAAADRREGGDLLPTGDGTLRARIDVVAGEQRPLLPSKPGDGGAHPVPDLGEGGARGDFHNDRRDSGSLAIAREKEHGHGHDGSGAFRAAGAAWRRRSCTRLSTPATIASIPAFTSARRVKAVDPGVCTIAFSRSTARAVALRGDSGTVRSSPRVVRRGISPRLTQPIGRRAARQRPRNVSTSPRRRRRSPTRAKPVEKLTTGP